MRKIRIGDHVRITQGEFRGSSGRVMMRKSQDLFAYVPSRMQTIVSYKVEIYGCGEHWFDTKHLSLTAIELGQEVAQS